MAISQKIDRVGERFFMTRAWPLAFYGTDGPIVEVGVAIPGCVIYGIII
jgi:hypothetical protein